MGMTPAAILFDFDGVIADSEIVSAAMFARALSEAGLPTTIDEAMNRYTGYNREDVLRAIADHWGARTPADIADRLAAATSHDFASEIAPIAGAAGFIARAALPIAIGSSSSSGYIRNHLGRFGLERHFGAHVYSGREHVTRGKPHPDIYLHAAAMLGVDARDTVIIEDSPIGTRAAVASGATVIGLCAGGHCRAGHGAQLLAVGAHHVATSYDEVARLLAMEAAA